MLYVTKNGGITRKPDLSTMNRQSILEYVIGHRLDQRQLVIIETNWKAFIMVRPHDALFLLIRAISPLKTGGNFYDKSICM